MVIVSLVGVVASEVAFGFSTGIVFAFITRFMTGIFNGKFNVFFMKMKIYYSLNDRTILNFRKQTLIIRLRLRQGISLPLSCKLPLKIIPNTCLIYNGTCLLNHSVVGLLPSVATLSNLSSLLYMFHLICLLAIQPIKSVSARSLK